MDDWNIVTDKIFSAISNVETDNIEQLEIKVSTLLLLNKLFSNKETYVRATLALDKEFAKEISELRFNNGETTIKR